MAAGVTVKASFDFRLMTKRAPKLMVDAFNDISDILRDDMKQGAARGEDINGRKFEPLQPETIIAKRRTGSPTPTKPLFNKGRMIGAGASRGSTGIYVKVRAKVGAIKTEITLPRDRQVPGVAHNEGLGNNPARRFFYVIGRDNLRRPQPKINRILRDTTRKIAKSAHKGAA